MSCILNCCEQEAYVGVDDACMRPAIFCIQHSPHNNKEGLLHQMMPLAQFKRSIN